MANTIYAAVISTIPPTSLMASYTHHQAHIVVTPHQATMDIQQACTLYLTSMWIYVDSQLANSEHNIGGGERVPNNNAPRSTWHVELTVLNGAPHPHLRHASTCLPMSPCLLSSFLAMETGVCLKALPSTCIQHAIKAMLICPTTMKVGHHTSLPHHPGHLAQLWIPIKTCEGLPFFVQILIPQSYPAVQHVHFEFFDIWSCHLMYRVCITYFILTVLKLYICVDENDSSDRNE